MIRKFIAIALVICAACSGAASAQVVLPIESEKPASVINVNELVVYHKQRQELILQATVDVPDQQAGTDRLAFVIPLPAVPDLFTIEDSNILHDMTNFCGQSTGAYLTYQEMKGEYMLSSPIVADGDEPPSEALNDWLATNGLNTIAASKLKYYDDNNWCFIVERVHGSHLGGVASFKPVRLSFGSTEISFPVRLAAGGHPMNCNLMLLTKNNLDVAPLEDYGFNAPRMLGAQKLDELPATVSSLVSKAAGSYSVFKELRRGNVWLFSATGDPGTASLTSEVQIPAPDMPLFNLFQNLLAIGSAAVVVIVLNRSRKKAVPHEA